MDFSISSYQRWSQFSCGFSLQSERCITGQQPSGILTGAESSSKMCSRVPLPVRLPPMFARISLLTPLLSRVRNHLRSHTRRIRHSGFCRRPRTDRRNLWCSCLPKGLRRRANPIRRIPFSALCLCYARGPVCWTFLPPPSQNRLGICRYSLLGDYVPYASLSH